MKHRIDPDGRRLPIKLDSTSNGEFVPVPLSRANRHANHLAQEAADANAAAGRTGGFFDLPAVAATEPAAAAATLETGEFIFDVQGHYVDPTEAWLKVAPESAFDWSPKAGCALADGKTPRSHLACLTSEEFVIHKIVLEGGAILMQQMTNLSRLPVGKRVQFFAPCLKMDGAEGSPVRYFALLDDKE